MTLATEIYLCSKRLRIFKIFKKMKQKQKAHSTAMQSCFFTSSLHWRPF